MTSLHYFGHLGKVLVAGKEVLEQAVVGWQLAY